MSSRPEPAAPSRSDPPHSGASDVGQIWALFAAVGGRAYDEAVSQELHARQCAAHAVGAAAPRALVAAALLHDVGHLLAMAGPTPDRVHERTGADWLAALLPEAVLAPIRLHVIAKRYLCATDPAYRRTLSAGSERSLVAQGGALRPSAVERFEARAGYEDAVALRLWDDRAKDPSAHVPAIDAYHPVVAALAISSGPASVNEVDRRRGGGPDRRA